MSLQETTTYLVNVRLSTEQGECPDEYEFERLVADQMSGVLDEDTGLHSIAVYGAMIVEPEDEEPEEEPQNFSLTVNNSIISATDDA